MKTACSMRGGLARATRDYIDIINAFDEQLCGLVRSGSGTRYARTYISATQNPPWVLRALGVSVVHYPQQHYNR